MLEAEGTRHHGEQLHEAREHRHLTKFRACKLSGVSRRHIGVAERGGNISLDVLRKLMLTYGMQEITIGPERLKVKLAPVANVAVLDAVADDLKTSIALAQQAMAAVEIFTSRVGKSTSTDTPPSEEGQIVVRGADLIGEFTNLVRSLADHPERLAKLRKDVGTVLERNAAGTSDAKPQDRSQARLRPRNDSR